MNYFLERLFVRQKLSAEVSWEGLSLSDLSYYGSLRKPWALLLHRKTEPVLFASAESVGVASTITPVCIRSTSY